MGHRVRDGQVNQRAAAFKGIIPNVGHRVRNCHFGQRAASFKSAFRNVCFINWDFDHKQQSPVNDATQTGDRVFVGAYHYIWLEDNTHNSIFSDSRVRYLCIVVVQQVVVSDNYLDSCSAASELVPRLSLLDLLLECPACCLRRDFKNHDFATWLQR